MIDVLHDPKYILPCALWHCRVQGLGYILFTSTEFAQDLQYPKKRYTIAGLS